MKKLSIVKIPLHPLLQRGNKRDSGQAGMTRKGLFGEKGLTLVEVMIASVIVLILFLALMQSVLLSINMNVKNQLRDTAVNIAEERMRELRSMDFDPIPPAVTNALSDTGGTVLDDEVCVAGDEHTTNCTDANGVITRRFRDFDRNFTRRRAVDDLDAPTTTMKSITVRVSYMDVKDNRCSDAANVECTEDSQCPGYIAPGEGETCGVTQTVSSILRKED